MSAQRRPRVILAEDEPATRALLTRQLQQAGYQARACADGREALAAIRAEGAGIIIADWMMPEMDGLELCRAVHQLRELGALGVVYFILLTAHRAKSDIVAGLEAGADDYLTKPYHHQELLARLRAGQRVFDLQRQLVQRQLELHKINARMALLNAELEKAANTDYLTGLANRHHFFQRAREAWALARRHRRPLACIMLDTDRFKRINDACGHAAGDLVLKNIAATIRQHARRHDICARFGGEEFIVLCPETPLLGAGALAERIRVEVAARRVAAAGRRIAATLSAGVAARTPGQAGPDDMIAAADQALYRAKDSGRNQVWIAECPGRERRLVAAAR